MNAITILRSDMIVFGLDEAIAKAFNKPSDVVKDHLIGTAYGTVEINGVAYDWTQSHDRFRFFPAE
jgi:hypothetical protein